MHDSEVFMQRTDVCEQNEVQKAVLLFSLVGKIVTFFFGTE